MQLRSAQYVSSRLLLVIVIGAIVIGCVIIGGGIAVDAQSREPVTDLYGDALPPGAVVRLGTTRLRYGGRAGNLHYSRDGRLLTVMSDCWFHVFDAKTGKLLRREDLYGLLSLRTSDDTLMLGRTGQWEPLVPWNFTDPKSIPPRVEREYQGIVREFVSGDVPQDDDPQLGNFTISPDGKTVATAVYGRKTLPRKIQLWRFEPDKSLRELQPLGQEWTSPTAVGQLIFSDDGRRLAVIPKTADHWKIMVCDVHDPGKVITMTIPAPAVLNSRGFAFSGDGKRIAVGTSDAKLLIYDIDQQKLKHKIAVPKAGDGKRYALTVLDFSPDGKQLAGGGQGNTIWIWDVESGRQRKKLARHHSWIEHLAFSPDGRNLASAGQDGAIQLWDLETGTRQTGPEGHNYWVFGASFSPDGTLAGTCGADGTTRIWEAATGKQLRVIESKQSAWATSCRFSHDGSRLAVAESKRIVLYETQTGETIWQEAFDEMIGAASDSVSFSANGVRLSGMVGRDRVTVWEPAGRGVLSKFIAQSTVPQNQDTDADPRNHQREVQCACLSPDGRQLAIGTTSSMAASSMIEIWDVDSQQQVMLLIPQKGGVRNLQFSPDGRYLASAGHCTAQGWVEGDRDISSPDLEDSLILWDLVSGKPIRKFASRESEVNGRRTAYGVTFSPDGKHLITAERAGTVLIYEAATGKRLAEVQGHWSPVQAVTMSTDGKRLLSVSHDHTGLIWDFPALLAGVNNADSEP